MGEYKQRGHVPSHLYLPGAVYMVIAGTYQKIPVFNTSGKLKTLQEIILERCELSGWDLRAWLILQNHYHFLARAPADRADLSRLNKAIHSMSAILVNRVDETSGRCVWYNYWDTCVRSEVEYFEGLKYILQNPVRHGVVDNFREYPYSSYKVLMELSDAVLLSERAVCEVYDYKVCDDY